MQYSNGYFHANFAIKIYIVVLIFAELQMVQVDPPPSKLQEMDLSR